MKNLNTQEAIDFVNSINLRAKKRVKEILSDNDLVEFIEPIGQDEYGENEYDEDELERLETISYFNRRGDNEGWLVSIDMQTAIIIETQSMDTVSVDISEIELDSFLTVLRAIERNLNIESKFTI